MEPRALLAADFDVVTSILGPGAINGYSGMVAGDFDSDGRVDDLFFREAASGQNRIAYGLDNEHFRVVTNPLGPGAVNGYTDMVAGDFDADGVQDDLYFRVASSGQNRVAYGRGNNRWDVVTNPIGPGAVNGYTQMVAGDFDADGRIDDLFFRVADSGQNRVAYGRGNNRWDVVTNPIGPGAINGYTQMVVGDLDQDGQRDDLFFRVPHSGENRVAYGRRNNRWDIVTNALGPGAVNGYTEMVVGDFDADGKWDDLYFRVADSGANRIAYGRGNRWDAITEPRIGPGAVNGYTQMIAGDFDGDTSGDDLFFWERASGANRAALGRMETGRKVLYVNFEGASISANDLDRWSNERGAWPFRSRDWEPFDRDEGLDANRNGIRVWSFLGNHGNREYIIGRILNLLREDLHPFGLEVRRHGGLAVEGQGVTTVFVGANTCTNVSAAAIGVACDVDSGNDNRTDIAFAWGDARVFSRDLDQIALHMALVILHEAAHTYGLEHVSANNARETMNDSAPAFGTDATFLNQSFRLRDGGGTQNSVQAMRSAFAVRGPLGVAAVDARATSLMRMEGAVASQALAGAFATVAAPLAAPSAAPVTRAWPGPTEPTKATSRRTPAWHEQVERLFHDPAACDLLTIRD